jgi:hypothetical protein
MNESIGSPSAIASRSSLLRAPPRTPTTATRLTPIDDAEASTWRRAVPDVRRSTASSIVGSPRSTSPPSAIRGESSQAGVFISSTPAAEGSNCWTVTPSAAALDGSVWTVGVSRAASPASVRKPTGCPIQIGPSTEMGSKSDSSDQGAADPESASAPLSITATSKSGKKISATTTATPPTMRPPLGLTRVTAQIVTAASGTSARTTPARAIVRRGAISAADAATIAPRLAPSA